MCKVRINVQYECGPGYTGALSICCDATPSDCPLLYRYNYNLNLIYHITIVYLITRVS